MTDAPRHDGRAPDQLRDIRITRNWLDHAEGSVLVEFGRTRVLCAASFTEGVPRWLKGRGTGWVTSEYEMLPRSTNTRSDRESRKGKVGGRTHEISRLIGRSLRAIIDTKALGENTIVLDCDVLQADGGTRTASITGAYVALVDAIEDARAKGLIAAGAEPLRFDEPGTYVPTDAVFEHNKSREWNHGMGEIVTAVLDAGLRLTMLVEHDSVPWEAIEGLMTQADDGEWRLTRFADRLPLSYTLQAVKPSE